MCPIQFNGFYVWTKCVLCDIFILHLKEVNNMATVQKDTRIDLRIENSQKDFLVYAASLRNMKLSAFVIDSALKEAEDLIANKVQFPLTGHQWKAFCSALDRPAREITKLKKLFKGPDIFHG